MTVPEGLGSAGANTGLDAVNTAYRWVKLHTGAPGANGTSNAAVNTTRHQATDAAASGGAATTSTDLVWSPGEVTTTETYTHFTRWSLVAGGTFGYSGTVTSGAVTAGTEFTLPASDLDSAFPLAS